MTRIGANEASNFNNRSMGLDSEYDLTIDAALDAKQSVPGQISRILYDLVADMPGGLLKSCVRRSSALAP